MNELALFAGAGGGILGGKLLGWTTVCAVEIERYPRECLLQRQRDGVLPEFPIWDDVCTFDGRPWRGLVDVISGGFPCQDISAAGKGAGIDGERSGLWAEMHRIICEVRPRYAFMENSPMLTSRGLGRNEEYHEAGESCEALGAPPEQQSGRTGCREDAVPHAHLPGCEQQWRGEPDEAQHAAAERCGWWGSEPRVGRVADGVAARVDRLKCLGNGQVPLVAASAFKFLERVLMSECRDFRLRSCGATPRRGSPVLR